MTRQEAAKVLIAYNRWRRYDGRSDSGPAMPDPKEVGEAIDVAIVALRIR